MYDVVATKRTPALFIYMIDITGSIAESLPEARCASVQPYMWIA